MDVSLSFTLGSIVFLGGGGGGGGKLNVSSGTFFKRLSLFNQQKQAMKNLHI